jgi:hypothetical protein
LFLYGNLKSKTTMKKQILYSILAISLFAACSKSDDSSPYKCANCTATPEAKPAYDNSAAGVYKGVLVGSTGTIALYLFNDSNVVKALVAFDGQNAVLTNTTLTAWTPGMAITAAVFTGVINGQQITATFSVGANGTNPVVTVNIPGHTVTVGIYKETSTAVVKNFEGTYSGDDQGVFNMTLHGNDFSIVTDGGDIIVGTLINNKIDLTNGDVTIKGEFQGTDELTGTWVDADNNTHGTFAGKRTL